MGIYTLNFLWNFYCVIIPQNIGIKYFLDEVLNFAIFAETTSHEFRLNTTVMLSSKYSHECVHNLLLITPFILSLWILCGTLEEETSTKMNYGFKLSFSEIALFLVCI